MGKGDPRRQPDIYEIRVKGHLSSHWAASFPGLALTNPSEGETLLSGRLPDQAALHGVLMKIRDLNMLLISVRLIERGHAGAQPAEDVGPKRR